VKYIDQAHQKHIQELSSIYSNCLDQKTVDRADRFALILLAAFVTGVFLWAF
jgi:hypothetical protein